MIQTKTQEEDVMARYLLGELPDVEQEALEEKLFLDDEWFDRLRVVEMELIDDYVQGKMSAASRAQFEKGFLTTPERIAKIANAKALSRHIDGLEPTRSPVAREESRGLWAALVHYLSFQTPVMQYAMAAAVVLLTVGALWLVYDRVRLQQQVELARNEQQRQAGEDRQIREQQALLQKELESKQGELQRLSGQAQSKDSEIEKLKGEIAALRKQQEILGPGEITAGITTILRAGPRPRGTEVVPQPATILLNPGVPTLKFQIELPGPILSGYDVSLSSEGGTVIREWTGRRPRRTRRARSLFLSLPASLLAEASYRLDIRSATKGHEPISAYQLEIVRR